MVNMDEHGIRYTLYRADAIDGDLLHELMYTHGKDLTSEAAEKQEIAEQREAWESECEALSIKAQEEGTDLVLDDFVPDLENFDPQIAEPIIAGVHEGVTYQTTWLGGALHLWIFESPMIGHFRLCSPCVPGACDGDARTDRESGYAGYDIPPGWRWIGPDDGRSFADRLNDHE